MMSEDSNSRRSLSATSTLSAFSEQKEYFFKLLVIGDACVGKTSYIERYVHGKAFKESYKTTIGVDFAIKDIHWSDSELVRLQLWDLSGQERYASMSRVYYRDAVACMIFFDLTRVETFRNVVKWKYDLDEKVQLPNGRRVPCILVGNKCDMDERPVPREEIDSFCKKNGFVGWIEVSVKRNYNLEQTAKLITSAILNELRNEETPQRRIGQQKEAYIRLNDTKAQLYQMQTSSGCCTAKLKINNVV